jgi:hypothetical protein
VIVPVREPDARLAAAALEALAVDERRQAARLRGSRFAAIRAELRQRALEAEAAAGRLRAATSGRGGGRLHAGVRAPIPQDATRPPHPHPHRPAVRRLGGPRPGV